MFGTVRDVGEKFISTLEKESAKSADNVVEIKDLAARFTTDVIGSCAFGLECNSLENPKSEFREKSRKIFDKPKYSPAIFQLFVVFKTFARKLHVTIIRKEVSDFFLKIVKETVEYRENNKVARNDFMHLLIQLKNTGTLDDNSVNLGKLTIEEISAQAFIFFAAGWVLPRNVFPSRNHEKNFSRFETSSTAMSYTLFELSQNQTVQDKARDSVRKVLEKHEGLFTYEAMMEMSYIENCISGIWTPSLLIFDDSLIFHDTESLRKYPPVTNLTRRCNKDYQVEDTNFVIKKGQMVFIPAFAIQHDHDIYQNPSVYDPDRFLPEEVNKRSQYAYLPFGQGPRNCIGLRFGIMQAKIGLAMLLDNFKFETCSKWVHRFI